MADPKSCVRKFGKKNRNDQLDVLGNPKKVVKIDSDQLVGAYQLIRLIPLGDTLRSDPFHGSTLVKGGVIQ